MLVVFAGQGANENFRKTVCSIVRKYAKISEFSKGRTIETENRQIQCVFESDPEIIRTVNGIIFFNRCKSTPKVYGEKYCICNSSSNHDVFLAKHSRGEVITCGFFLRDSITFSSCCDCDCVISLQRRIKRADGSFAEPCEFPVHLSCHNDRYGILCAYLLLIILGYI